jgi:hypothetical protein
MIIISTTTKDEVRAMFAVMRQAPPDLEYGIYLLGRKVRFLPPPESMPKAAG